MVRFLPSFLRLVKKYALANRLFPSTKRCPLALVSQRLAAGEKNELTS